MSKRLWDEFPRLVIIEDLLCRKVYDRVKDYTFYQVVIPEMFTYKIMKNVHGSATSGHFSVERTMGRLSESCYWPHMRRDVETFCKECVTSLTCQLHANPNPSRRAHLGNIESRYPFLSLNSHWVAVTV